MDASAVPPGVAVRLCPLAALDVRNISAGASGAARAGRASASREANGGVGGGVGAGDDDGLAGGAGAGDGDEAGAAVVLVRSLYQPDERVAATPPAVDVAAVLAPLRVTSVAARTLTLAQPYGAPRARTWRVDPSAASAVHTPTTRDTAALAGLARAAWGRVQAAPGTSLDRGGVPPGTARDMALSAVDLDVPDVVADGDADTAEPVDVDSKFAAAQPEQDGPQQDGLGRGVGLAGVGLAGVGLAGVGLAGVFEVGFMETRAFVVD